MHDRHSYKHKYNKTSRQELTHRDLKQRASAETPATRDAGRSIGQSSGPLLAPNDRSRARSKIKARERRKALDRHGWRDRRIGLAEMPSADKQRITGRTALPVPTITVVPLIRCNPRAAHCRTRYTPPARAKCNLSNRDCKTTSEALGEFEELGGRPKGARPSGARARGLRFEMLARFRP